MTYSDKAAAINVLKEHNHIVKITKPSLQNPEDTSTDQSLEKSSKPVVDDEIRIRVTVSRMDLATIIKLRMGTQLRTSATVQSRVNKRMLRGFEGFHGELTKLWDNVQDIEREDVIRRVAEDKLRNEKNEENRKKNKTRWEVSRDENLNPILTDTWTAEEKQETGDPSSSSDSNVITLGKLDNQSQTVSLEMRSTSDSQLEDITTEASLNQSAGSFSSPDSETVVGTIADQESSKEAKLESKNTSTLGTHPTLRGKEQSERYSDG